ncbi:MAG: peptidoglycan-associated lipoprotein Pal [Rhodobacteraceae bacterium]|nr:peptidoglycan-associated lipoprotein Pal [Paracoccaceae bacterium]
MNRSLFAGLIVTAMALGACTNPGFLGDDDGFAANSGTGGAPATGLGDASDPTSAAFFQQSVGDRVFFEVDQSTLTADGRFTLDGQAGWLMANPDYTAVIEGHADEQGTREYNLALGARRADAARAYLLSKGVPAGRLQTVSYGKERPIEVCSDENCYSKNRRAVTVLAIGLTG